MMHPVTHLYRAGIAGPLEAELLALLKPFALTACDTPAGWYLTLQDGGELAVAKETASS